MSKIIDWLRNRAKELSSHYGIITAAATAATEQSAHMPKSISWLYFAISFLMIVTPEWNKPQQ